MAQEPQLDVSSGFENDDSQEYVTSRERVTYNLQNETWFRNHWRPAMAWTYMAICIFDFIIAPVAVSILITFYKSTIPVWTALTLQSGGLIHVAFGTILGVAAWGRTKEREVELGGYQYAQPTTRTVTRETTILGNNNKTIPPRPQKQD